LKYIIRFNKRDSIIYYMISVPRSRIPLFLQESHVYKELYSSDEDDEVSDDNEDQLLDFPSVNFKWDTEISNIQDLKLLLSTLRYWGTFQIPHELVNYIVTNDLQSYQDVIEEFESELRYLRVLPAVIETDLSMRMKAAARSGVVEVVSYVRTQGCDWDKSIFEIAAASGSVPLMAYLLENGCPWDELTCEKAAATGQLQCLAFAHQHGCPWNAYTCSAAAEFGQEACLSYALEQGCDTNEAVCYSAAKNNHLGCLTLAREFDCPWNTVTCTYAAMHGHLECLMYAHQHGCPWDESTTQMAVKRHQWPALQYAVQNDCPVRFSDLTAYRKHC
jgi:hypothetical protein